MAVFGQFEELRLPILPCLDPTVPKGTALIRLVFHAHNTNKDIDQLLDHMAAWATQTLASERGESQTAALPIPHHISALLRAKG
jgi:8-amino-7-oxononanoate synthase